ncbi:hypothetical protein SERLA73DRAFT_138613, partial [Serpula lacrymans var. lacrymans S7.3]
SSLYSHTEISQGKPIRCTRTDPKVIFLPTRGALEDAGKNSLRSKIKLTRTYSRLVRLARTNASSSNA